MRTIVRLASALVAGTLILLSAPHSAAAYGEGWADCLYVSDADLNDYGMSLSYDIKVKNGCDSNPGGFSTFRYEWSTSPYNSGFGCMTSDRGSKTWPSTYSSASLSFDVSCYKPGTYFPTVKLSVYTDYSDKKVELPSFTISAPADPDLGSSAGSGSSSSSSDTTYTDTTCLKVPGDAKECWDGDAWYYDYCWTYGQGAKLQKYSDGAWKTVKTRIAANDGCSKKNPWTVSFSRTEGTYGTKKYRLVNTYGVVHNLVVTVQ